MRWRFRARSCPLGDAIPSAVSARRWRGSPRRRGTRRRSAARRRRLGIGLELVEPLPVAGLLRVRVRAGVGEPVAVGRSSAEEPALRRRLGAHGRADAGLDPHPLALRHAAEEHHHQVVRLGAGVDGAADLGHPQLDAVVREHRERQPELVAVERPLRLADDHGREPRSGRAIARAAEPPRADASTAATGSARCRRTPRPPRRRPAG